jgi:allantoinase
MVNFHTIDAMTLLLPTHDRYSYSAIDDRPDYSWPGDKRLAFYIATNIEIFAFLKGIGSDFALKRGPFVQAVQTHRSYAWRDYGNRVGIWRLFKMFDQLALPAAHNVNTWLYQDYPQIFERIRARGDEIIAHGRTNAEHQRVMWEHDEECLIREATELVVKYEGKAPMGWYGGGPESNATPDLLKEAGYKYLMNWAVDDQPFWMNTRSGKILCMPYPLEVNDAYVLAHRQQAASDFGDMIVDQFEEMIKQCVDRPLVFGISLHSFVAGQPFRTRIIRKALAHCLQHPSRDRLWITRPGDIARHCYSMPAGIIAGSS